MNPESSVTAQEEPSDDSDRNHANEVSSNPHSPPPLPSFIESSSTQFQWHDSEVKSEELIQNINAAYNEIVHWKKNLFMLPSGKQSSLFVDELARLLFAFDESTPLQRIALKSVMIMPALLLQKPHEKTRCNKHVESLKCRLEVRKAGNIQALLHEGHTIQQCLSLKTQSSGREKLTGTLANLMFRAKFDRQSDF